MNASHKANKLKSRARRIVRRISELKSYIAYQFKASEVKKITTDLSSELAQVGRLEIRFSQLS